MSKWLWFSFHCHALYLLHLSFVCTSCLILLYVRINTEYLYNFCQTHERRHITRLWGGAVVCGSWVQVWSKFYRYNCCAVCTTLLHIAEIYREFIALGIPTYSCLVMVYSLPILIARFMGTTWGPSGADRSKWGHMLAPWTLLSGITRCWMTC